ncbi:MAG: arginine N-succinyltransferase [Polyangiaceae bacterium]
MRFEIRGALLSDEAELVKLAHYLNSVNLPHDRAYIRSLLEHSERSFSGAIASPPHRKYVFLIWDHEQASAVGTSMIVAQLGRRDAPYIYLDVIDEEKYSRLLDKHFHHTALRLGFSYNGPTEIGGLVVAPEYRAAREKLGLQISYVRFLFIAMHRALFRDEILAELLPPLEPDGTSHLWEALGRRFTDMSYADADRLSSENKEFIRDLFPTGLIYASVLSPDAQGVIGKVGTQTRGVEKMLRRIGFRYADRVDPFDGGPHFVAPAEEISLIQNARVARVAALLDTEPEGPAALIGRNHDGPPYYRAVASAVREDEAGLSVPKDAARRLQVDVGDDVHYLALR